MTEKDAAVTVATVSVARMEKALSPIANVLLMHTTSAMSSASRDGAIDGGRTTLSMEGVKKMKLIKCRKCGATICTDQTFQERMLDCINELSEKARRDKKNAGSYLQQASAVKKIMTQYLHRTAQMDEHRMRLLYEHKVLVHYVLDNGLVSQEKLNELDEIARKQYAEKQKYNQQEVEQLYRGFDNITFNRTKSDPTEDKALKGMKL